MTRVSIGKAWDEAKATLRANRRLIVPVALGLLLLPAVILAMLQPPIAATEQVEPGAWMIAALLAALVMVVGQIAIVLLVNGWRGSVGEVIAHGARRMPVMIGAALIVMLPLILLFSVILAVTSPEAVASGRLDATAMRGTGSLVLLLCLVALIYVSVRLLPMIGVIAEEKVGPIAALRRSFALSGGNFWRLLGFVILIMIAFVIAALVAGAVFGSLITLLLGRPEHWSVSHLLIALIGGLVQTGFIVVYTAMLARIYVQLAGTPSPTVPHVEREV